MPLYEFYCEDCDEVYQEICPVRQNLLKCPNCGKFLARQISLGNFHLKGVGWSDDARKQRQRWYDVIPSTKKSD
jgi:putative FmdB family regulatory protein